MYKNYTDSVVDGDDIEYKIDSDKKKRCAYAYNL
jgi:hypothetical protein